MKNPFPNSSKWKVVLLDVYRHCPNFYFEDHKISFWSDEHFIAKKLKMTGADVGMAIEFLKRNKLVEDKNPKTQDPNYQNNISLTEKGFNVAFELDKQLREEKETKRHGEIQISLIFLTFVLAITGSASFAIDIYPQYKVYYFWFYALFFIGLSLGVIIKMIFRKR